MSHMFRLFSCTLVAATIACGSNKATIRIDSEEIQDTSAVIMRVEQGSAQVTAINKEGTTVNVTLFADDHLIMLDEDMTDSQGQLWKSVVVDNNSESGAEIYYIKANDLAAIAMNIISEDDDADWSVMRAARMTYCYRYVKQYLLKVGLVKVYLPGVSAYMAADILPKHGFKKVSRKPSKAIVHDVCVYKGGPSGHGHIEIKTSKGWYYGYGYKQNPIQNRIFIGCFHK